MPERKDRISVVLERTPKVLRRGVVWEKVQDAPDYFAPPIFERADPPFTRTEMLARETHMMDVTNIREGFTYLAYSPSKDKHYDGWRFKWDEDCGAGDDARRGKAQKAKRVLLTREDNRDKKTGYMPNKSRIKDIDAGKSPHSWPERTFYNNPDYSSYTQPSLLGWSAWETYKGLKEHGEPGEALGFLEKIYGTAEPRNYTGMQGECAYFLNHRRTSKDNPLLFIVHPNETGRDYDTALGFPGVDMLPGKGKVATGAKTGLRWARMQQFGHKVGKIGHDPEEERLDWIPEQVQKLYAVNDVMFNAFFVRHLRYTAQAARELAKFKTGEAGEYKRQAGVYEANADEIEKAMLSKMWHENEEPKDKKETFFYNINAKRKEKQINVKSITGLFPLMLEGVRPDQVEVLLDRLDDPEWFGTNYPIPTHAAKSKYYDPDYTRKEGPNWQGPVWVISNFFLVEEGLVRQAKRFLTEGSSDYNLDLGTRCMKIAENVVQKTEEMLSLNKDVWEFYNPKTGQGYRVRSFMWSNLGLHFDNFKDLKSEMGIDDTWLN